MGATEQQDPHVLPENIGNPMSLLTDKEFREAKVGGYLFMGEEDFDERRVRQASYELTLESGRTLLGATLTVAASAKDVAVQETSAFQVKTDQEHVLVINPWQCCLLMVKEQIRLPDNVIGRVMSRGQLFQSGLIVESTYVDPGFKPDEHRQSLHLMAFNATQRVVKLPIGVAIARLELVRVSERVQHPHGGRNQIARPEMSADAWPWPENLASRAKELEASRTLRDNDSRLLSIDRLALAVNSFSKDIDKLERSSDWYKVLFYFTGPLIIWLALVGADIGSLLSEDARDKLDSLISQIPAYVPILFFGIFIPALLAMVRKDFRKAFGRIVKPDGE